MVTQCMVHIKQHFLLLIIVTSKAVGIATMAAEPIVIYEKSKAHMESLFFPVQMH